MPRDIRNYAELADFLERLLRNQMYDGWEIDDFESLPIGEADIGAGNAPRASAP